MKTNKIPEVKRLRLAITISIIILAVICFIHWSIPKNREIGSSGIYDQNTVEEQAKWIVDKFNDSDSDALISESEDQMKESLTTENIENAKSTVSDDWGAFQSYGDIYTAEIKQRGKIYASAQMTATYENVSITYTFSFDEDMKLVKMYIR